ncbi:MAG: hypothetical protein JWM10_2109 [Myxococcaceae bacterium]|nr:hypothetical protein [Myxococcaceae bacterium]
MSKYDPAFRDARGAYQRDEWSAVSDVGRAFAAAAATPLGFGEIDGPDGSTCINGRRGEDLRPIQAYVEGRQRDLTPAGVAPVDFDLTRVLSPGRLTDAEVGAVTRLALREVLPCELVGERGFRVFFGYDYLVGVRGDDACAAAVAAVRALGIFVEETGPRPGG